MFRLLLVALLIALNPGHVSMAADDPAIDVAERFVKMQTQGLPGEVSITMGELNTARLPPCSAHEAFLPPGTRLSGKTYIGVRCLGPSIWSVLIPAQIRISGQYVTTTRALAAGQIIAPGDLTTIKGDLATLPSGVVTSPEIAVGKTLRNPLAAGQPLRQEQLQAPLVIRQGQSVKVVSKGQGFSVSAEGKAITNASEGQVVQIRMASGQTVSGIAKADGSVEIAF